MSDELTPSSDFFTDVRGILADARRAAYTAVNSAMVAAYWQIGRRIVEEEQGGSAKASYGEGLLKELSRALTAEFGKGFSLANLKNFRKFYLTYPDPEICYALCSKLTWSHNRLIMREEEQEIREFYLQQASRENWSVRTAKPGFFLANGSMSSNQPGEGEIRLARSNFYPGRASPFSVN